ncbi:hypothetical protein POM88_045972 [Heracleum sosnowskyi]|uniref:Reverse transcriptase zinc-binding domain-containing protein n=1 Tax=Heracleum sosnowskyi TaxID=360622 RepID=A0AAD8H899_9APIA|nr:hypothetical protein POM88_045972 [Heracleum sosnowskyi]
MRMKLLAWNKICTPKEAGGLGLVPLKVKNMAMMGKWVSRWNTERRWIKDLQSLVTSLVFGNALYKENFKWRIKSGSDCLFWEDIWYQHRALKDTFKMLYQLSRWHHIEVHSGILPTRSLLANRIKVNFGSTLCNFCNNADETVEHLFWNCTVTRAIWLRILKWWSHKFINELSSFGEIWDTARWFKESSLKKVWKTVIAAFLWTCWLARNEIIFRGAKLEVETLFFMIKGRVKEWLLAANLLLEAVSSWWEQNPT